MPTIEYPFARLAAESLQPVDDELASWFDPDEAVTYEYRPPAGEAGCAGLLVYISPKPGAAAPDEWGAVLDASRLGWIGARDSGNEVDVPRRIAMSLLAPTAARLAGARAKYAYLSGFSGGGRVATMVMSLYPDRFAGALFICGANPLQFVGPDGIDALAGTPLVFLTGTGDFNLEDTRFAIATWQQAGLAGATLEVVEGLGHALPEAGDLARALALLVD